MLVITRGYKHQAAWYCSINLCGLQHPPNHRQATRAPWPRNPSAPWAPGRNTMVSSGQR